MSPHAALLETDHRPRPLPRQNWSWRQSWCELLFAHWRIDAGEVARRLPSGLEVDLFDGCAWVGVVPFRMQGVMRRPLPDLPWLSAFPELNVRTYVTCRGKPGVWFFSLDATNPLAVWAARRWFDLPYHRAAMSVRRDKRQIAYDSRRTAGEASLCGRYQPIGEAYHAERGSLEHWLTERYCLFAADARGRLSCTDVHHKPWPLQRAEAHFQENTMLAVNGLTAVGPPELLHYAERVDVVVWSPESVPKPT